MSLPKDPNICLSYVNTKLRDDYSSLEGLCESEGIDKEELEEKLREIGYIYNPELNQFR